METNLVIIQLLNLSLAYGDEWAARKFHAG
jgi:hypothetical protein